MEETSLRQGMNTSHQP